MKCQQNLTPKQLEWFKDLHCLVQLCKAFGVLLAIVQKLDAAVKHLHNA